MKHRIPTAVITLTILIAAATANSYASLNSNGLPTVTFVDDLLVIGGFTFDTSELGAPPAAILPPQVLTSNQLEVSQVTDRILQNQDGFVLNEVTTGSEYYESPTWLLQRNLADGVTLALHKPTVVTPQPVDEEQLRVEALLRLDVFGIGKNQICSVFQRKLMCQEENDGHLAEPTALRYKTFVKRGLNGIEVEGHRAVLTYGLDGSLDRVWLNWPALAQNGHRLRTNADDFRVVASAFQTLMKEGEVHGKVQLRWKYVPTMLVNGEVQLELKVGARFRTYEGLSQSTEAREFDVDVLAY